MYNHGVDELSSVYNHGVDELSSVYNHGVDELSSVYNHAVTPAKFLGVSNVMQKLARKLKS